MSVYVSLSLSLLLCLPMQIKKFTVSFILYFLDFGKHCQFNTHIDCCCVRHKTGMKRQCQWLEREKKKEKREWMISSAKSVYILLYVYNCTYVVSEEMNYIKLWFTLYISFYFCTNGNNADIGTQLIPNFILLKWAPSGRLR